MAYRCSSCDKFCSLEAGEPEVTSEDVDGVGMVCLEVQVPYTSGCCCDEVANAEYSLEEEVEVEHTVEGCEEELVLDVESIEATDRFQEKDRHGKPIRSYRYRRHYYGVVADVKVTCPGCAFSADLLLSAEAGPPEPLW